MHAWGEQSPIEHGLASRVEGRQVSGDHLVQDEPERPHIHLLLVEFEEVFRQDDVFFHLRSVVVEGGFQVPYFLLHLVGHEQGLADHYSVAVHVKQFTVQGTVSPHLLLRHLLHRFNEILQHGHGSSLRKCLSELFPPAKVLSEGALVQNLSENLYSLSFFHELVYLHSVYFLFFVVLVKIYFLHVVVQKLVLVAVLAQVDESESGQSEFGEPCQTVLVSERPFFFSFAFENPKLFVFHLIFLLFRISPAVVAQQLGHAGSISDPLADRKGLPGNYYFFGLVKSGWDAQDLNCDFEDGGRPIGQQSLDFRHADALRREHAVEWIFDLCLEQALDDIHGLGKGRLTSDSLICPISLQQYTRGQMLKGSEVVGYSIGCSMPGEGSTKGGSLRCRMMMSLLFLVQVFMQLKVWTLSDSKIGFQGLQRYFLRKTCIVKYYFISHKHNAYHIQIQTNCIQQIIYIIQCIVYAIYYIAHSVQHVLYSIQHIVYNAKHLLTQQMDIKPHSLFFIKLVASHTWHY